MPPLTLENVLVALGAAAALFLAWNAVLLLLARRYRPERGPDELYRTTTDDGWALELGRYKPLAPREGPRLPPVICCHGLGANAISLDMAEEVSLARTLRARGFDVWLLDLRGCGGSSRPPAGRGRYDYSFDDLALRDVTAAVELVKRETGAPKVAWVGHSMGGAVAYAHMDVFGDRDFQAVATIASPTAFVKRPIVAHLSPYAGWHRLPGVHHELVARLASPVLTSFYSWIPLTSMLVNPRNCDERIVKIGLTSALANMSTRLMRQFARWTLTNELVSEDGARTYFRELGKVKVPWLAIAGAGDELVPPENVRPGWEKLGSPEKSWLLIGEAQGHAADYGHCDLVMGTRCRAEVFEPVADFLLRYPLEAPAPAAGAPVPATA